MKQISFPLITGGALTGLAMVLIFKPASEPVETKTFLASIIQEEQMPPRSVESVMASFQSSQSTTERLRISNSFRGFSSDEFEMALARATESSKDWRPNQAIRCLLVAWARKEPRKAMEWSWSHFKSSHQFESAFDEVILTWVDRAPLEVVNFFHEVQKSEDALTKEQAEESQSIILDRSTLDRLRRAFFVHDSTMALLAVREGLGSPSGSFPRSLDFTDLLNTREEVEAAQEAWRDIEGGDLARRSLANRWDELNPPQPKVLPDNGAAPPSFQGLEIPPDSNQAPVPQRTTRQRLAWEGARTNFERTAIAAQSLDPGEREAVFLAMYDSWHLAHPDEVPDLSLLPIDARMLWQDLDGLGAIQDSFSGSRWSSGEFETQ